MCYNDGTPKQDFTVSLGTKAETFDPASNSDSSTANVMVQFLIGAKRYVQGKQVEDDREGIYEAKLVDGVCNVTKKLVYSEYESHKNDDDWILFGECPDLMDEMNSNEEIINNIGMDGGTHFAAQLDMLPRRMRWQFTMPRHELQFPLVHPTEVAEDPTYQREYYLLNAWNNPCRKVQYSLEELWLNLRHGNFSHIMSSVRNRVLKTLGLRKHK